VRTISMPLVSVIAHWYEISVACLQPGRTLLRHKGIARKYPCQYVLRECCFWAGLTSQTCEDYFLMNPKSVGPGPLSMMQAVSSCIKAIKSAPDSVLCSTSSVHPDRGCHMLMSNVGTRLAPTRVLICREGTARTQFVSTMKWMPEPMMSLERKEHNPMGVRP